MMPPTRLEKLSPIVGDLYARHAREVYKRCFRMLKNHASAEDATHEVFKHLLEKEDLLKDLHDRSAYVFKSARNHCINVIRQNGAKEQHHRPLEELESEPDPSNNEA